MSNKTKGIIAILIASFGFSLMSIFIKLSGDVPIIQKVLFRNGVSMIVGFIMVTYHKERYFGKIENQKLLLLRSALGTVGMLLFFYSISQIVTSDANALNKLSSFFLILFSFIFLKEKANAKQVIAIIVAFFGSLLIIQPSLNFNFFPYLTSILAAIAAGAAYTVLRALGQKEKYYTIVLYFSTFSFIVLFPFVFINYQPMSGVQILYLLLTGVTATIGQFGTTIAYKYAPAKEISIYNYSNVVFVTILAIPFLGELPNYLSVVGYAVIFSASMYMYKVQK